MSTTSESRRISILRDSVSQKIAAGEVIERPASVVRELIDNAVDSGAKAIDVYVAGGGVQSIVVIDDGSGMDAADLEMCYRPHATSKISEVKDLDSITTLGFRGEALSSIAACAELSITSSVDGGKTAFTLEVIDGHQSIEESRGTGGTTVSVSNLFHDLPGRRRFLKRAATETLMCRTMVVDKAIAFPDVSFRFFADNELKIFLPPSSQVQRVSAAFGKDLPLELCHTAEEVFDRFSVEVVGGDPSLSRRDRRRIYVYVNKRKVQDFALVQAVTYGFSEYYPGGTYPVAAVFIELDPELADFNIHPAKREVRIRNSQLVHHSVVQTVRSMLDSGHVKPDESDSIGDSQPSLSWKPVSPEQDTVRNSSPTFAGRRHGPAPSRSTHGAKDLLTPGGEKPLTSEHDHQTREFTYYGQVFGLFLLAGLGDTFYIIDQHAAHERYIFDLLMAREPRVQELLIPEDIETEAEESAFIERSVQSFRDAGIGLEKDAEGTWQLRSLPESALYLKQDIATFVREFRGTESDVRHALYETIACKTAVKDGEVLDDVTAIELIEKAFALPQPRCPHGRPVWVELARDQLFSLVGRT